METTRSEKTPPGAEGGREYALGHSDPELERLSAQARLLDPFTRPLLRDAGLCDGMRVLDLGCGHGDVSLLASELVGPLGHVVGLDTAPAAVEAARRRTAALHNVEVVLGDVAEVTFEEPFDAAVGRLVLMYCPDPVEAISAVTRWVRPGGLVIFHEFDLQVIRSQPLAPLYEETLRLATEAVRLGGADTHMGLALHHVYRGAGLPTPALRYEAALSRQDDATVFDMVADLARSALPTIERFGLGTAEDLQLETLARRMRDEVVARDAVVALPPLVGAYARVAA
jgi:SAM-dependent methyltransferase